LLQKTKHVKVWISYGQFETDIERKRAVFKRACEHFRVNEPEKKEERLMVLESWHAAEV